LDFDLICIFLSEFAFFLCFEQSEMKAYFACRNTHEKKSGKK